MLNEALYQRLPVCLQNAACSWVGWRLKRTRFGLGFHRMLAEGEARMAWSEDQLCAYRDDRLRRFLVHCVQTVPYYRRLFREHGVDPARIRSLADLRNLPILTKDEVQRCCHEMVSEAVPKRHRIIAHTSGTTGGGLRFATTLGAIQEQFATWWRYRRWHGIQQDMWCGYFGGRSIVPLTQTSPPFWRWNLPQRRILFSGYHLSPENLPHYVAELRTRRLNWLHGYPSLLALLGAHILASPGELGYRLDAVTIGAENLLPQQAAVIEKAFGVRPRQHYGMAEAVANISECPDGQLHVDEDFAAVEFVPNADGEGYRVVGTNLSNPATPLVRYDTQDLVSLSDERCRCGRVGRVVRDIDGRREDYVVLANGARVGRMDHIFKDLVNIREAQIYQARRGEIIIRVVKGHAYGEADERRLLQEAHMRVGDQTRVEIEHVDSLPRSRTGKLRFVISQLDDGRLVG